MSGVAPEIVAVCSTRPRPSVQNNRARFGSQWWARDVYHIRHPLDRELTYCGRDCSEWLTIGVIEKLDDNCCKRCAAVLAKGG